VAKIILNALEAQKVVVIKKLDYFTSKKFILEMECPFFSLLCGQICE